MNSTNSTKQNSDRITKLELAVMHLQKDYQSLNEVILDYSRQMDLMAKNIQRLTSQLKSLSEPEQPGNAEDEKPPHY